MAGFAEKLRQERLRRDKAMEKARDKVRKAGVAPKPTPKAKPAPTKRRAPTPAQKVKPVSKDNTSQIEALRRKIKALEGK